MKTNLIQSGHGVRFVGFDRRVGVGLLASRAPQSADPALKPWQRSSERGFTLVDVIMALVLAVLLFGGVIATYVQAGYRAERAGFSLAAQGLAIQQLEQARAAKWDILDTPNVDEFLSLNTNPPACLLDIPVAGTNYFWATNRVKVSMITISSNPVVNLHAVKVETVWSRYWMGKPRLFTNTLCGYFAPDR